MSALACKLERFCLVPFLASSSLSLNGLTDSWINSDKVYGATLTTAVLVTPPWLAEIVTDVVEVTALVATVKVAVLPPAATLMLAGIVATVGRLLASEIMVPPLGAGLLSVTVPVEGLPPVTLLGFKASAASVPGAAVTVSVAVLVTPL